MSDNNLAYCVYYNVYIDTYSGMQLSVLVLLSGMMIETMAGKSAALHGLCHDATPFTFSEDNPAVDYFGKLLLKGLY